jgi:soluble lytic murein transglycosylase-like protein
MAVGLPGAGVGVQLVSKLAGSRALAPMNRGVDATESAAATTLRFRSTVFENRPTPASGTPAPTSAPAVASAAPQGSMSQIIYSAAAEFGIGGDYLLSVASCESDLDPQAYNAAGYYGLFQFDQTTWSAYGYGSIYDPTAQARTAARLLAAGQSSRWPNCA